MVVEGSDRHAGARYRPAVELAAGDVAELTARAGRSPQGRAVVAHLAALGRPATVEEVTDAVGSSPAVLRRLVKLGVLRSFLEIQRLSLDGHLLRAHERAAGAAARRPGRGGGRDCTAALAARRLSRASCSPA